MMAATHAPASLDTLEPEQGWPRALGRMQDTNGRLRDDAELAFRAGDEAEQIVSRAVEMIAAERHDGAVEQHDGDAEQVVGGDAVFQAMRATGIHRDVARDRAGELARWIWRVEKALIGDRLADAQVGDARLDPNQAVREIDLEHPVHLGDAEHDGIRLWNSAAGERGAGAARHHLDAVVMAEAQDGRDLGGRRGQNHRQRHLAIGGQPVGLEGASLIFRGDQGLPGNEPREACQDFRPA